MRACESARAGKAKSVHAATLRKMRERGRVDMAAPFVFFAY
jgi:hypothetical protein